MKYYTKFQSMILDYDKENPVHEANLKRLYRKIFDEESDTCVDERWKDIGFQGKDPRTDFRGGGHLSLLCLLYMIENYPEEWMKLCKCTKE